MPACKRKKNGLTQYRSTYRWKDENLVEHQTTTPWFNSKIEADNEAKRLSKAKGTPIGRARSTKKVSVVFDEFMSSIDKSINDRTLKNKSTDIAIHQRCNSIKHKYFPAELKNTMVKDVNSAFFRRWLESMNREKISGHTIRSFKAVLQKFNKFMANTGYYSNYNMDIEIAIALGRVDIKPRKTGERKDRRLPTQNDIEEIRRYYEDTIGEFRSFYYYTFFYFEFYTGCRVSETIALQWKNVDLNKDHRIIHIVNGISEKEKRSTALRRTEKGNYSTKNDTSERDVVIFDMIYQLLIDYKQRYKIHYKLSEKDIQNCFVFPALSDPYNFARHSRLLEELKRACEGAGIEELDNGMFRHGCATWLVAPEPDGLGYSPEQVYSQLGHCDSKMIKEIYGKLQKTQLAEKNRVVFNDIYHPEENKAYIEAKKEKQYNLKRAKGGNKPAEEVSKALRFTQELERIKYKAKKKVFYYYKSDIQVIRTFKLDEQYPMIEFILKEDDE